MESHESSQKIAKNDGLFSLKIHKINGENSRKISYTIRYFPWISTENSETNNLFSVNLRGKWTIIFAIFCEDNLAIHLRWRHLTPPKLLLLTNQTKLTLTVTLTLTDTVMQKSKTKLTLTLALTLTDTVMVIFFTCILSTPMKRLYRNNKKKFCGGAVAGFVGGPVFFSFSDFLPVCWQEFDSKFILYQWKKGFLWGYIRKRG